MLTANTSLPILVVATPRWQFFGLLDLPIMIFPRISVGILGLGKIETTTPVGRGKTTAQLGRLANSYVAADDIETGAPRHIPLWIFGLGY